ncbi:sulfurtransferase [Nakamurella aerolata]|uniref:Sulfurtransferase n=1 Tax=Nakamurella aerolata TaxID=1656892 RepID=A0A849ABX5_9ACTN|nr:sulfurtransferase [Nakamurella aerolata]NNG37203.1 sulfurtransferase [Nakamurella aerolata]
MSSATRPTPDREPTAGPGPDADRSPLITAQQLRTRLDDGLPPVLLDVRWTLAGAQRSDYLDAHLPGARFIDLDTELAEPHHQPVDERGRHPLPQPDRLQRALRAAGVRTDSPVVVYDARNGLAAARAWWLLRWAGHPDVQVLDGGLAAWTAAGGPTETGEPGPIEPGDVTVRGGQLPVAELDEVIAVAEGAGTRPGAAAPAVLLDARAPERYRGEREPMDPRPGHIPGAINLPMADLIDSDGRMLPIPQLRQRFSAALTRAAGTDRGGADSSETAPKLPLPIASCGSGITACHTVLAAEAAGIAMAMFPGSYSGWCATGRVVGTGEPQAG